MIEIYYIAVIMAVCTLLALRYVVSFRGYLKELNKAIDRMLEGDFSAKVSTSMGGELGKVGKTFNLIVSQMNKNIIDLEDKNAKLKAILKSISNGIIAIDNNENILLMNKSAKFIVGYELNDYESKQLDFVVKNKKILTAIKNIVYNMKISRECQIDNEDKIYNIKVDPIKLQDEDKTIIGSIINIEDVTEKVKLEKMRSDFVANVTHELKTPLTSINGFVETLKGNDDLEPAVRNRFLDIIDVESNRLKNLIDDILILSFIENHHDKDNVVIDLKESLNEVLKLFQYQTEEKNVSIEEIILKEKILVYAPRDYFKHIFINLIDNAIKYSPVNSKIEIEIEETQASIKIKVIDNGMGIPKEDISRIFERFYRVDKARSRKIGGTGLGLAIVKHIVMALNGTIKVMSEVDKGSKFIVEIPKNMIKEPSR